MNNLIDRNINSVKEALGRANTNDVLPSPYIEIAERFKKARDTKEAIIVEEAGFPYTDSTVMYIEHVESRWAGGYSLVRYNGSEVKVPKTIHYSDIYVSNDVHRIKIVFEGAHPYEES
ncbi:hypothetical protein [Staphylococcus phage vB_SauM-V1SA22]|nr:hypothetical protein [Staphylococcus phage vB_SauM-V1SA22]UVT34896.1 hypothetical protein [Staphylococcus phage vB_SauM-V1SA20]